MRTEKGWSTSIKHARLDVGASGTMPPDCGSKTT